MFEISNLVSVESNIFVHQQRSAKNQSAPIGEETKKHFFFFLVFFFPLLLLINFSTSLAIYQPIFIFSISHVPLLYLSIYHSNTSLFQFSFFSSSFWVFLKKLFSY